ncbi:MAG: polysaccharide biosynthesis tyrosine autokinase [Lentisphaeria bacterium]|nr:polysaccharide biosynthesis tyrosine autokinase [Lentisphaeria bacterium]
MQNMDFWFFWDIFRKRWNIILFVACAVAIATSVYSKLFIKPVYRAEVTLYFGKMEEQQNENLVELGKKFGVSEQLNLGTQLTQDYQQLVEAAIIKDSVEDELAKRSKIVKNVFYRVSTEAIKGNSRSMKIIVDSNDAILSQDIANIYADVFKKEVPKLVGVQNITTLNEAKLNKRPVSPNVEKNILIGFVVGFLLSYLVFIAARLLNRALWTSEEVEKSLNVPVVGTVHKDKDFALDKDNPFLFGEASATNSRTQVAEDFRVFRVNLINQKKEGDEGSVIAVTSAQAKEGKTFCTANLGASLAEAGYKVLLIDCDTGKRGLQTYLGTSDEKGLMNILEDETDFEHTVKKNLNNMNMDVLFCGNKKVNSANLMISPKFKELMKKVKQEYDYAFLDVSCHLGTADIVSAGSTADSVLLLVRAGKTEEASAKQTIEALNRANLDISGVILNGVEDA